MKAVNNYLKNVMKSVAYAAADVSEEYVPGIKEFTSTNKEFATAAYSVIKNPTQAVQRSVQAIQESKIYKALDYGARNLSEDLRTGNFYNKARKERDELALSGLDANWDDLSDFDIDSDWESKLESSSSKSDEITAGDMKIVQSIEGSNAALANATVNAVITSSQNEIKNNRANVAMIYTQNERLFGGLHKDMTILGTTMQQMYKLQSASLQNIDKNMSSFFTQESKLSAERNAILKEMLEMQRNMYKSAADKEKEASKRKSSHIRWSDINVNGVADINAYFGAVKKNINSQLATIIPAGFGEDSNMLATFMVSPLEGAMKYVVNGVIPATVKAAAKEFDASVSGIFGNIIGELGNARSKNSGGILGTIAKFFGISTGVNRSIDTSKYEKGPVPFDGITRKAIIDVIPTHLRRIEAAITGRPEEMFDYRSGRWVKVSSLQKQYDSIKTSAVKRATSELREAMNPAIQRVRKGIDNKYDQDSWDAAIEEFEMFLYENNGRFNPRATSSQNGISAATYPNLYKHYSKIKTIFNNFDVIESTDKKGNKIRRNTRNSIRMKLSGSVLDAKDYEDKQYRDIESDVTNVLNSYFGGPKADAHGKYKTSGKFEAYNTLKSTTDDLGNTIFDYLQNINKELIQIRLSGGVDSDSSGRDTRNQKLINEELKKLNKKSSTNNYGSQHAENERISKNALQAIASGKAIDLRDFSEDEQAYLLQLSEMISGDAITEYKNEIKGYNENVISGFMDKHFIKTNIKSMKDIDEAIKKAEKSGKNTNQVMDHNEDKFFRKIMKRIGAGETVLGGIVGASSEAFTNLLYTADKAIYEMMYKTEISDENKQKYNGFMDMMANKMTDTFKKVSDWFEKDILEPFKRRLGIDDDFKGRFKDSLINTGSRLWTSFKDANASVYGPAYEYVMSNAGITTKSVIKAGTQQWDRKSSKSRTAYDARKARNLAILHGGAELAHWCEVNGFTGSLDEKKVRLGSEFGLPSAALAQIRTDEDANRVFAKQFRHHARGTTGRPFSGLTTLTKGEGLISGMGVGVVPKTGVYNVSSPTHIINTEDMHALTGRGPKVSVQSALGKEKLAAKAAGFNVANNASGTMKITNNGVDINASEFLSQLKQYIPEAASGGLIGGILSMLLGVVGGPLLGAAVGAGASVVGSSDTLKDKLFGKIGEDGKRDGSGFISKTVMNAYNKYFPDMAKYGLAGIIPGLITPLGPIGGLLVGGAFGYLKNNERFTNKYFGEKGKLTIGSKEKKIIEQMMPGAAKGAIAGAISTLLLPTPWGIMGNAAIGAAVGMMGSTEEFKNSILGQEINGIRVGGLVNEIKDVFAPLKDSMRDLGSKLVEVFDKNIIDPIARFVTPAIHAIPQLASIIPRKINEKLMSSKFGKGIQGFIQDNINPLIQNTIGKFLTPVAKTAMNIVTSPVRLLGWAGDKIRGRQIKTGNADYMTARERVEWMKQHGKGKKVSAVDRVLADIGTDGGMGVNDATKLSNDISSIIYTEQEVIRSKKAQEKKINAIINGYKTADGKGLSKKAKEALRKAMEAGDMDRVRVILSTYATEGGDTGLSKEQIETLMNGETGLGKEITKYMNIKDKQNAIKNVDKEQMEGELGDLFEKLGIDRSKVKDRHFMAKFAKNLETEVYDRKANETGKGEAALETENNIIFKDMSHTLTDIRNIMYSISTGDTEALKKLGLKHESDLEQAISDIDSDYGARDSSNALYIGNDAYSQYSDAAKQHLSTGSRNFSVKIGGKRRKLPGSKKATRANRDRDLILKYKMTPDEVNACDGKVFRLSEIMKEGFRLDPNAISMLNGLTDTQFNRIKAFIKSRNIRSMLIVRKLTKEDISFFLNELTQIKLVDNKCEFLLKTEGYDPKQFESLEEVMSFEGDRTTKKGAKDVLDFIVKGDEVQQNGLGTLLLGAGKSLLGGAGRLISSLFNKNKDSDSSNSQSAGLLSALFSGAGHGLFNRATTGGGDTNEVDKAGDGKDVLPLGDGYGRFRRDSSGNVQPDTSDSHTKSLLNKLEIKEQMANKLQEAQLKAYEIIKNNFDTSSVKESNGGKLGWLSMLLTGGLLWKSGILQKLFDGFIKPIWTDHVKPWIKDTAVPWIQNTAIPALGKLFGTAISGLIQALPTIIITAIKGAIGIGDALTQNKYNAGATNTVNGTDLVNQYGADYQTGMYDENGNALTASDIANGNYGKIYNAQGVEGIVNSDGTVTFKDGSMLGASYANTVINAGAHGFAKSLATGRTSLFTKAASGVSNFLTNRKGLVAKGLGYAGKMLTKPVEFLENAGVVARNKLDDKVVKSAANIFKKARAEGATDITLRSLRDGDGSKISEFLKKFGNATDNGIVGQARDKVSNLKSQFDDILKKGTEEAAEEAAEKAVTSADDVAKAASKNGGFLSKIITRAKEAIDKLFENPTVKKELGDVATSLGFTDVSKWISSFKNSIDNIFGEALEKGIKKVGADTCKKVLSKALTVVFLIADFLTGCDQAESILGVKETTVVEELVAGLVNSLCNFLIIPSIVPGTNWIVRKIYSLLDKDFENRQAEATKEYEQYVEETGSTLTQEEYLARKNSVTGKIGGWFSDAWNNTKNALFGKGNKTSATNSMTNNYGTGAKYGKGAYSKQIDPSVSGIRFNTSADSEYQTIGNSGCGPAAAVNAIESMYGRGSAVANAAKFALSRGYKETNGGTKPGFFTDYFNSNGFGSLTSYNKSAIARNIMNGMPTVIMGSDARGTSSSTPFGRTPHYVTVTGTDGRGNAIVQDPESKYDNQLYPLSSLMKNTAFGVSAYGRGRWGRGNYDSQIWYALKQMGMTDAGAAGMMGNLYAESSLNPNNLQNTYEKSLGMTDAQYTAAVDNGSYTNFVHDSAGYGLAQWTYHSRKKALYDYIKSKNVSIGDPVAQLEWLGLELKNNYPKVFKILTTTNSLSEASDSVLMDFERPSNASSKKTQRQGYGQTYLNKFAGSNGTAFNGYSTSVNTNTSGTDTSSTDTEESNNIFSLLANKFGNLFGNSNAGKATSIFSGGIGDIASLLFKTNSTSSSSSDSPSTTSVNITGDGDIAKIVNIAKGEVGTKETGENYVKYNDWYWGEGKGGPDLPWCAAFTSWVANQAGIPTSIIPKDAYTVTSYNKLVNNGGKISNSEAQPGDYIFFTKDGKSSGIYHTGIVTGNSNGVISTVEGNSSDMVAERSYNTSDSKVLVARPKYTNPGTFTYDQSLSTSVSEVPDYANTRGSNGIKPLSRYGQFKDTIYGRGTEASKLAHRTKDGYVKVERSAMDAQLANQIKSGTVSGMGTNRFGMGTTIDYSNLINAIINILMTIADNTDKLNLIVTILNNKLGANVTAADVSNATTGAQSLKAKLSNALSGINSNSSKFNNYADDIGDSSINYIISAMNAIASE